MPVVFEPFANDWKQDPYPVFQQLRDEAPVHWAPQAEAFCISRYEDVTSILNDPGLFKAKTIEYRQRRARAKTSKRAQLGLIFKVLRAFRIAPWNIARSRMLIQEDGEAHRVMRNIVNRGFTSQRIAAWEPRIRALAAECVGGFSKKERFDLVDELAVPLPVGVICAMLGIDPDRRHDFKRWSNVIIEGVGGADFGIDEVGEKTLQAMAELRAYLAPIARERRRAPREDLISTLVTADSKSGLSDFEVFLFVMLLLVAGNETTTNLIGNAVDTLLDHPDQLARATSDTRCIPALIEESLRFESPIQYRLRLATADTELGGTRIAKGSLLVAMLGAANRDERRFPDADRFDMTRDTRGHLAFGFGAHFCLGAALARLEAKIALETVLPILSQMARVTPERSWVASTMVRGQSRMELLRAA
jgi:cytochrome P450